MGQSITFLLIFLLCVHVIGLTMVIFSGLGLLDALLRTIKAATKPVPNDYVVPAAFSLAAFAICLSIGLALLGVLH